MGSSIERRNWYDQLGVSSYPQYQYLALEAMVLLQVFLIITWRAARRIRKDLNISLSHNSDQPCPSLTENMISEDDISDQGSEIFADNENDVSEPILLRVSPDNVYHSIGLNSDPRQLDNTSSDSMRSQHNLVLFNSVGAHEILFSVHSIGFGSHVLLLHINSGSNTRNMLSVPTVLRNLLQMLINSHFLVGSSIERRNWYDQLVVTGYPHYQYLSIGSYGTLASHPGGQLEESGAYGHYNLGTYPFCLGVSFSYGHHRGRFAISHAPQSMGVGVESHQRTVYEVHPSIVATLIAANRQTQLHPSIVYALIVANRQIQLHPSIVVELIVVNGQIQGLNLAPNFHSNPLGFPEETLVLDRYNDMRLDADAMSYEELLALGNRIGSVRNDLSDETIMVLLRRKSFECGVRDPSSDAEACAICREEYVLGEDIGMLNCNHEFHTECIKQWLAVKNNCPICKSKGVGK